MAQEGQARVSVIIRVLGVPATLLCFTGAWFALSDHGSTWTTVL